MKANEAAEHSNIIKREGELAAPHYKIDGKWYCQGEEVHNMNVYAGDDYVPFVPKKIYKVGDKVTFLEALNSGMCFTIDVYKHTWLWSDENLMYYVDNKWTPNHWGISSFKKSICTLVDDPSIPPKPTLESLPAWTRCKVKPVNHNSEWQVIKKPSGSLMHHYSGNDFEWVNVELISIYNPKTEQWEDV